MGEVVVGRVPRRGARATIPTRARQAPHPPERTQTNPREKLPHLDF